MKKPQSDLKTAALKKKPVKIWSPWRRQVTWTVTCHIKLLPDNFLKKSPSLNKLKNKEKCLTDTRARGRKTEMKAHVLLCDSFVFTSVCYGYHGRNETELIKKLSYFAQARFLSYNGEK